MFKILHLRQGVGYKYIKAMVYFFQFESTPKRPCHSIHQVITIEVQLTRQWDRPDAEKFPRIQTLRPHDNLVIWSVTLNKLPMQ